MPISIRGQNENKLSICKHMVLLSYYLLIRSADSWTNKQTPTKTQQEAVVSTRKTNQDSAHFFFETTWLINSGLVSVLLHSFVIRIMQKFKQKVTLL